MEARSTGRQQEKIISITQTAKESSMYPTPKARSAEDGEEIIDVGTKQNWRADSSLADAIGNYETFCEPNRILFTEIAAI